MAIPRVLELLMSAGDFSRASTTDRRNRLVEYYRDWFASDYKVHTIDNIRVLPFLSANRGRKEPLDRENPAVPHLKTEEPNIRATQRLMSHAKAMGLSVGVVLMAILEEASGLGAAQPVGTRGLLGVEAGPADTRSDEGQGQGISLAEEQAEDTPVGDAPGQAIPHESAPEPVPATPPTPSQGRRPTRSKGPPAPI